jgi:hypothetical protein
MLSLVRADWFRIRRRWDVWIIVLGIPALALFAYVSGALSSGNMQVQISGDVPPEFQAQMAAQDAAMRAFNALPYQFPRSIVTVLEGATTWLVIGAAFLTASLIGHEFGWGTIRNVVLFQPDRSRYLAVRLLWIVGLVVAIFLALVALGALLPALVRVDPGDPAALTNLDPSQGWVPYGPTASASLGGALLVAGAFLVSVAGGVALVGLCALKFRSVASGLLGAGIYVAGEGIFVGLVMSRMTGDLRYLPQLTLITRLTALVGDAQQAAGLTSGGGGMSSSPGWVALPPLVGASIVAIWIAGLIALWFVVLRRADIHE